MALGYNLPSEQAWQQTVNFLIHHQFPAVMEKGIEYFATLPMTGIYKHVNQNIKPFDEALHATVSQQFTLSGVGSFIDYDKYGHNIKRPTPQLAGTACNGGSLCLQPTCFGFVEGVIESNNLLRSICWSLSMSCLKDQFYSDKMFAKKMESYMAMFFSQPVAVLQAYQRTNLIKESIKVVATKNNFRFSGPVIGGSESVSLPFYISPTDATNFPNTADFAATDIGGFNIDAFVKFVAPRLFAGAFNGGIEDVTVYGLSVDLNTAAEQTATVVEKFMEQAVVRALANSGYSVAEAAKSMIGSKFIHDGLFPTFKVDAAGDIVPVTQEILEPSTVAGVVQTTNPEHTLAPIRGLLFVPNNWKYDLVAPPIDDFSMLGLGNSLNFGMNTPGVTKLSSSLFANRKIASGDKAVIIGMGQTKDGMISTTAQGVVAREKAIAEAVRTELRLTYSNIDCASANGQLPNVGYPVTPQGAADGFALKSTMYIGTNVKGTARPVLVLFKTDTPRSAQAIEVCSEIDVTVDSTQGAKIVACCPGGQIYATITFSKDISGTFSVGNDAIWRTGMRGASYEVEVTAVSGNVVTIQSADGTTLLPCCAGQKDDYGVMGELLKVTGATATSSEIMKAEYTGGALYLEFFDVLAAGTAADKATITLADGQVIEVVLAANATGVFASVTADVGETCTLANLDCACLVNAVFAYTVV